MLTKEELLCALEVANIEVPPKATLPQLRMLYEQSVPKNKMEEQSTQNFIPQRVCADEDEVTNNGNHVAAAAILMKDKAAPTSSTQGASFDATSHQLELMALRAKIMEMEQRQTFTDGRLVHPEELKHLIPEFSDGLGINKWINTIRYNSELYGWQDRTMLLYAGSRLTGAASEWYNGFRNTLKTFDEFADTIKKAFPDRCNEAVIHSQLASVYKKISESYTSYVYRVNALGMSGHVSEEAIITYVIRGLSRDPLYDSLVTKDYRDIYDLIDNIKRYESHLLLRKNPERRSPSHINTISPRPIPPRQTTTEPLRCYNCSNHGHHSSQCTQPRRAPGSCFRCGSTSHVIRNCPVPDRRQLTVAAVQGNDNETAHLDSGENGNFVQLEAYQEL
ncbi:uncharacterized protein LOC121603234 [Anopheles merus]|nr:uncharacterized protein LOC120952895 [Anopheles coluzzii]XP_040238552.1 uncharacterized protein LOC120959319 isoform X1 [Anopheles coluzzii]XP_041786481.1 uncharacterized protein LOC121601740 [Anopheles merus]XP_041786482.1 uncharacterized protein LOC121601741 [Anopheles merus]XP_041787860.1 uncharacterized protein LOC121603234 [Anopheles merus]XP_049461814.1 uncharacterized protein LOC125906548 [Anopheles coluzzii]XP_049462171.1 uncharacterized protein LOC125906606 [Anopheles coluzzii]XP